MALSTPTTNTLAKAVPTAADRLLVVPRSAPTSPANSLGEAETRTLNTSVSSEPCAKPTTIRLTITSGVPQSFRTTKASHTSPTATIAKPMRPIWRGVSRSNRPTISAVPAKIASEKGMIATAVWRPVRPWTIWM